MKGRNKKLDISTHPIIKDYGDGIYYLRSSYERIFRILDAVINADNIIVNRALNIFYVGLLDGVKNILKLKNYQNIKELFFEHPDNVMVLSDELRCLWKEELEEKSLTFLAQLEKLNIKIKHENRDSSFEKVMSGVDLAVDHHIQTDKMLMKKINDDLEKAKKQPSIAYKYNRPIGMLEIKNHDAIEFKGQVAIVIKFFYENWKINNDYKSSHDLKEKYPEDLESLTSSELRKKIDSVNRRVRRETCNAIKVVITRDKKTKATTINKYRWEITV